VHRVEQWGRGWRLVVVVIGLAVLTHLPSLLRTEVLNPDEAFLATEAQVINDGGHLYSDVVDRKPPAVPYLYAATFRVTGDGGLEGVRVLAIAASAATALLLASIARRRWDDRAALGAAVLWLVASGGLVLEDSQAANFEVFMVPLMCASMWFADRAKTTASGLSLAAATMTKQVAATTLLPLTYLAWRRDRWRAVLTLAVSFAVPIVVVALLFGWSDFIHWVFTGSSGYLDVSGSRTVALGRGVAQTAIFFAANLAALLLALVAARRWREDLDLWLWMLAGFIAVSAGFRYFGHYYLQMGPPLALIAAGALSRARRTVWVRTAVLAAASIAVFLSLAVVWNPNILKPYDNVAAAIKAHTAPNDRIFVWGQFPEAYWASDRRPATRFLTAGFLTNYSGGRSSAHIGMQYAEPGAWDDFTADLANDPPALIVDTSQGTSFPLQNFPTFERYVTDHYKPIDIVDGAVLYARDPTR
jgi:4-amino-4-deoxy-L-arabinose transferase-like glycosyltransferase